jgi:hypothetical protein
MASADGATAEEAIALSARPFPVQSHGRREASLASSRHRGQKGDAAPEGRHQPGHARSGYRQGYC